MIDRFLTSHLIAHDPLDSVLCTLQGETQDVIGQFLVFGIVGTGSRRVAEKVADTSAENR